MVDLTVQDARALILAARNGDNSARDTLITCLLPVAKRKAARWKAALGWDEAYSVSSLALVKGVDEGIRNYSEERGGGLVEYVSRACVLALSNAADKASTIISTPLDIRNQQRRAKKGQPIGKRTEKTIGSIPRHDKPLDEPIESVNEDGELRCLGDTLADFSAPNVEHELGLAEAREHLRKLFASVISRPRDQQVMLLLYGLTEDGSSDALTEREVAVQLGLNVGTVKGIRQQGLKRLRSIPGLKEFLKLHALEPRLIGRLSLPTLPLPDGAAGKIPASLKGQMKLNAQKIVEIRQRRFAGETNKALAKAFGVAPATISRVTHRRFKGAA